MEKIQLKMLRSELIEWGRWERQTQVMGSVARGNAVEPNISDDRALQISQVVGRMRNREREIGRTIYPKGRRSKESPYVSAVIMCTYINQMTVREVAQKFDINRDKADKMICFGVQSVFMGLQAANDS